MHDVFDIDLRFGKSRDGDALYGSLSSPFYLLFQERKNRERIAKMSQIINSRALFSGAVQGVLSNRKSLFSPIQTGFRFYHEKVKL